jgi:hypothetical protein
MIFKEQFTVHVQNRKGHGYTDGYDFLDYWEEHSGQVAKKCSRIGCNNKADCGGHVYKYGTGSHPHYYIVPLCNSCNQKEFPNGFDVYADNLVDAPTQD